MIARRLGQPSRGTYHVAEEGLVDADGWVLTTGARELLVDGDQEFAEFDQPMVTVDRDGLAREVAYLDIADRIDGMTAITL